MTNSSEYFNHQTSIYIIQLFQISFSNYIIHSLFFKLLLSVLINRGNFHLFHHFINQLLIFHKKLESLIYVLFFQLGNFSNFKTIFLYLKRHLTKISFKNFHFVHLKLSFSYINLMIHFNFSFDNHHIFNQFLYLSIPIHLIYCQFQLIPYLFDFKYFISLNSTNTDQQA